MLDNKTFLTGAGWGGEEGRGGGGGGRAIRKVGRSAWLTVKEDKTNLNRATELPRLFRTGRETAVDGERGR